MTHEQLWAAWRLAQEPVPAVVVGAWGLLGAVIAIFIVLFRWDWRAGVTLAGFLVAATVTLLWTPTYRTGELYKRVGDVVSDPGDVRGRRLQVHGYVKCGSIHHRAGTDSYRLEIQHLPSQPDVKLEVRYRGLVPDTFDAIPDGIMAKHVTRPTPDCGTVR